MVLIKNEVTLMYKIFWSHVFALGIILSITFFHADSNGLMNDVLFSLLTVEMGFFVFYFKNTIKIWLSAKTQYLSAFSREQIHQFTTYLLPLNEPWYASFPRYAKIWYSTSVLKQEKNWIFYRLWNA